MARQPSGLIFVNLVDSDTLYGIAMTWRGYAANLERIDARLADVIGAARTICGDHRRSRQRSHAPSTDHSREYVPVLVAGERVRKGFDLGTRPRSRISGRRSPGTWRRHRSRTASAFSGLTSRGLWRRHRSGDVYSRKLEQSELEMLAPEAAKSADARVVCALSRKIPIRPAFQRDRDRIIHSKAFRRLKHKTQVFFAPTATTTARA